MYDLVTELEKIGDWDIVKNNLYAIQDNQVKKFNLKGEFVINIYTLKKYWGVSFYGDFFHRYTMYNENTFVDYNKKVLLEKDNFNFYHIFTPNRYIGFDRAIKKVVNQDKVILFNERINLRSVISNYFIFTNKHKNIIFTIDLDHPTQPLWQFNLSQLGNYYDSFRQETKAYKVEKIIGIWQNMLLVACSGHLLLAIDIETGKIIHQWKDEGNFAVEPNQKILFAPNFVLDEKNEILYSFTWHYHLIINLKTKELTVIDMADELSKHALSSLKYNLDYAIDETHVYTTARVDTDKLNINYHQEALIAIHRKNKTIDWINIFDKAPLGTNTPKLAENKLYQLDLDATLHIFEKNKR